MFSVIICPRTDRLRTILMIFILELRGPYGLDEGKRQGRLASSRQCGNAPLWSSPLKKKNRYIGWRWHQL